MLRKIARWNSLSTVFSIAFALLCTPVLANPFATQQPMMLAQVGVASPAALDCTGGTITTSGVNRIHTFNSSSSLVCTGSGTASYLVVGGGGGGGGIVGGGGGGGGVRSGSVTVSGTNVITVGAGGALATVGSDSSAFGFIGSGGGAGGNNGAGGSGGNGGGGANGGAAGAATIGFAGGNGGSAPAGAAGGGGAGAVGTNAINGLNEVGGTGGAGVASTITGASVTYAGGGGGGGRIDTGGAVAGGAGGSGGGGAGANSNNTVVAVAGTANLGGGGGGGGYDGTGHNGAVGGSGVVIVSYPSIRNPLSLGTASGAGLSTTVAMTGGVNIVAGDTVVVSVGHLTAAGTTVTSVSDGTNTYTRATSGNDGSLQQAELWYKINAVAVTGPTITATFTGSVASRVIGAVRIAGGLTALDVSPAGVASTASTAPTVSTGALASSNAEIVIGFLYVATAPTVTEGAGFTQIFNENASGATNHLAFQVTTSTVSVAYSPTNSVASNNIIIVAAFK